MKPGLDRLAVVTATLDLDRAKDCINSWAERADYDFTSVLVWSGTAADSDARTKAFAPEVDHRQGRNIFVLRPEILGVVPAFALGVECALQAGAEIIACFHDDLLIEDDSWDTEVLSHFDGEPRMGLCGFGGGTGLGHQDIYQKGYSPYDLAREGFISNMREAEAHGRRVTRPTRVACLDGFSQIGRREYWCGRVRGGVEAIPIDKNLMAYMADWGLVHHAYDAALGAFAARLGWETWMLPIACHHFGGRTAVGDPRYVEWAQTIVPGGDKDFWELAHRLVYDAFRDVLPIRV